MYNRLRAASERWKYPSSPLCQTLKLVRRVTKQHLALTESGARLGSDKCEDRVLDGPASGEKGSEGGPYTYGNPRECSIADWKQCHGSHGFHNKRARERGRQREREREGDRAREQKGERGRKRERRKEKRRNGQRKRARERERDLEIAKENGKQ